MLAEAELTDYLKEIREQVCSHCIERPEGGPPCAPLGKQCGIEMHLPQLIDAVREVHSDRLGPYLDNNRCKICSHCPLLHGSSCPCPMDYLAVLLVQAVETVDERRGQREQTRRLLPPHGEQNPGMEPILQAYEEATGQWTGCDWPTHFGRLGLNLCDWTSAQAKARAREVIGSEEEPDWRHAVSWLTRLEQQAADAEVQANLAVAAAGTGEWEKAMEHARRARVVEFATGRPLRGGPFTWQPLYWAIECAARANGWTFGQE